MKSLRLLLLVFLVSMAVGACSNPAGPEYPQPEPDGKQDPPPKRG